MVYIIFRKSRNTREADRQECLKAIQYGKPNERKNAQQALAQINRESSKVGSMRESLVKATREGNTAEIKDIHDYVTTHSEYRAKK